MTSRTRPSPDTGVAPRLTTAAFGYCGALVAAGLAVGAATGMTGSPDGATVEVAGQLGFWAGLLAAVAVERGRRGVEGPAPLARLSRPLLAGVAAVGGVATQLVLVPAVYFALRPWVDESKVGEPARALVSGRSLMGTVILGLSVVAIAPLVEELFFRGLLLRGMRQRWGVPVAVGGSSVVFGATHFQALQFPGLVAAGLVFATFAVTTGRLTAPYVAHAAFNAASFFKLVLAEVIP